MEFGLSEEQNLLVDSVHRFLDSTAQLPRVRRFAEEGNDSDLWQGLVDLGISGLLVPESRGGVSLGFVEAALVAELLGKHVTPSPFLGTAVLMPALLNQVDPDSSLLDEIIAGTLRCGIGLAEANGARLGAALIERNGKLSGRALFVLDAAADVFLLADARHHLYLVDAEAAGLTTRRLATVDTTRPVVELTLNNCAATTLATDAEAMQRLLDIGRVMLAADTLGAASNMIEQAVIYAKQREQFGRAIATFQAVKHMCAEMAAELEPCRAFVWYAGHALNELPDEARLTACHLKAHISEVGKRIAKTATEVHGGMGFTDLVGLHYWFKRIGFNRQMLGTPEYLRDQAARLQGLVA
ncbi:MAG: acyl-CoA dehydrogenase [Gammaproteobacteria bacterium]|nr:acyl-CoA dehydrogenase [Gammaproteobacteria bacterium]